ncbi:type I restriction endonuclease subunit R [Treponema pedis]|uniref:Type I restriction enzyme endonuclease subunit n=1 Tax=Treponema pedis TaxID=409322 RepID=A0A7S7AWS0_9SPIR|nr:HsdR family type I site-specific deoxyribonuclease [Treponema pedis]QOW61024.1 HsdR family type I site-specific deoxyribonuclease [Treponema pedis]
MPKINETERQTQKRILDLFCNSEKLNYTYAGNLSGKSNTNIKEAELTAWLTSSQGGGYSKPFAQKAVTELQKTADSMEHGLYTANKNVYERLKYGIKIAERSGEPERTVYVIDWDNPLNNIFSIAEEVTIKSGAERRPDLVVYVNGIALAVIELKKASVSVMEGIRQNISNQEELFNKPFFTTVQFCMAGNYTEGLRYGTVETKEQYYLEWKNDTVHTEAQPLDEVSLAVLERCKNFPDKFDVQTFSMFYKYRFLDLIHNFIIFDSGQKKVCRHNQFFGIKKAQMKLAQKQGGIIWHTQGSGKTLTMIWLSKWILTQNPNARVLIITDRNELDDQIEKKYIGVDENIKRTTSCSDLIEKLQNTSNRLMCSLIHKFGVHGHTESDEQNAVAAKKSVDKFIQELRDALPKNFKAAGDFIVFVDECHRTQSGLLHIGMKEILPHAIFIGFTGTPLLIKDKKTSLEVFSPGYIHTYKYDEAVADKAVLDLRYEARDIEQIITAQEKIDDYFNAKTRGLNDTAKATLKSLWANMQNVYSSRKRLEVIAEDIISDFTIKNRLRSGNGNAILAANTIYDACKYYEILKAKGFNRCAIITSFVPEQNKLSTESNDSEEFKKYTVYKEMLGGQSIEKFEEEAKREFIETPAKMQLLIVVDKLLTGFDAPKCTYLYIDKSMQDHGLFQAICRVNRLDSEEKEFGYIIDYKQLFGSLKDALQKYTSGAFEGFDEEDIKDFLKDRLTEGRKYLEKILEELEDLCCGIPKTRPDMLDYIHYFCGADGISSIDDEIYSKSREKLYKSVNKLIRAYAEIKGDMEDAGYTFEQRSIIDEKVRFYISLKMEIGRASGDFIDLKSYESDMRYLIDTYIKADDSRKLGAFDDFTLLDFILIQAEKLKGENKDAAAEIIENNIRKKIVEKQLMNPKYYAKLSAILMELVEQRRQAAHSYEELLNKYIALVKKSEQPENNTDYPKSIRTSGARRAFYDNFGNDEQLAVALDTAIRESKEADFRYNKVKEKKIKRAIYNIIADKNKVDDIYNLAVQQPEY